MDYPEYPQHFSLDGMVYPNVSDNVKLRAQQFLDAVNKISELGLRKVLLTKPKEETIVNLCANKGAQTMSVNASQDLLAWSEALMKIANPGLELVHGRRSDLHVDVSPAFDPQSIMSDNIRHFAISPGDYSSIWTSTNLITAARNESGTFPAFNPKRILENARNAFSRFRKISDKAEQENIDFVVERLLTPQDQQAYLIAISGDIDALVREYLSGCFWHQQYHDYSMLSQGGVVLNLGIEKGSEIPGFLEKIGSSGHLINVDPMGTKAIHPIVSEWMRGSQARLSTVPFAINNERGELELAVGKAQARDIRGIQRSADHDVVSFRCITLHDLIEDLKPQRLDLIKTDIEGGEEFIIDDIVEVASRFRSTVALSIYHSPKQYIELPIKLMKGLSDYVFRFRRYSVGIEEGILYAIPSERS